jgi:hypothetical protein
VQQGTSTSTVSATDIVQLLIDNPNRFIEENGIESLMSDLQLTEEQKIAYSEEKEK